MFKPISLFFCVCAILITSYTHAQQNYVYGRTLGAEYINIVQLASVVNVTTKTKSISSRQGYFKLAAQATDTIIITAVGYDSLFIYGQSMQQDTQLFFLTPRNIMLKEARIIASNPKRDSLARAAAEFLKNDPLMNNYDRILNRPKGGLMNPLTAMYEQFSKAGKDASKFEDFLAYMEKQKKVDSRFNKTLVFKATGLTGLKADSFLLFCKPNKEFVLTASDYELILAVKKCYADYTGTNYR